MVSSGPGARGAAALSGFNVSGNVALAGPDASSAMVASSGLDSSEVAVVVKVFPAPIFKHL